MCRKAGPSLWEILGVTLPPTTRLGLCRSLGLSEGDHRRTSYTECGEVRVEGAPRVHSGAEDLLLSPRAEGGSKATGKGSSKDTLGRGEVLMGRERATFWDRILTGLASVAWPRCSGTEDQGVPGCHGTDWRTLDLSGQLGDRKIPELKSPVPKGRSLGGRGRQNWEWALEEQGLWAGEAWSATGNTPNQSAREGLGGDGAAFCAGQGFVKWERSHWVVGGASGNGA